MGDSRRRSRRFTADARYLVFPRARDHAGDRSDDGRDRLRVATGAGTWFSVHGAALAANDPGSDRADRLGALLILRPRVLPDGLVSSRNSAENSPVAAQPVYRYTVNTRTIANRNAGIDRPTKPKKVNR